MEKVKNVYLWLREPARSSSTKRIRILHVEFCSFFVLSRPPCRILVDKLGDWNRDACGPDG